VQIWPTSMTRAHPGMHEAQVCRRQTHEDDDSSRRPDLGAATPPLSRRRATSGLTRIALVSKTQSEYSHAFFRGRRGGHGARQYDRRLDKDNKPKYKYLDYPINLSLQLIPAAVATLRVNSKKSQRFRPSSR